jgi:L-lactate dehydrogenase
MVGSATAFCLTDQGVCAEVVLVDVNKEKALGEVLDLQHSIEYMNRNVRVHVGDYEDCKDADIVVITASVPMAGVKDRMEMLTKNIKIMDHIVDGVMTSGFDGHMIVVSNPVDILSHYVYKRSGLPKEQVIGTGTALETARLKQIIAQIMRIDPRSVQAYAMGEHGDTMMVPWSNIRVAGKGLVEVMEDNADRFKDVDLHELTHRTATAGFEVLKRKGSTQFGIAAATTAIVSSILRDENKMLTVSTLLDGEYGVENVFCGVPAILGKEGVIEIGELRLTDEEQDEFVKSAEYIREKSEKVF